MTSDWTNRILELKYRTIEEEDLEFVRLVDEAEGRCDLPTCRTLMSTFVTDDDHGVQEAVIRVLAAAEPALRQTALVEELPRIWAEAPNHAADLVEGEWRFHVESFNDVLRHASEETIQTLRQVVRNQLANLPLIQRWCP